MHQPNDDDQEQKKEDKKLSDALKKHYFTFDIGSGDLDDLLKEMLYGPQIDDILYKQLNNFTDAIFATWGDVPLGSTTKSIFIGKNSYGEPVFKEKHFIVDRLYTEYLNHIRSHAAYFLQHPDYYRQLHEILN